MELITDDSITPISMPFLLPTDKITSISQIREMEGMILNMLVEESPDCVGDNPELVIRNWIRLEGDDGLVDPDDMPNKGKYSTVSAAHAEPGFTMRRIK